jgi:hypothetical protein
MSSYSYDQNNKSPGFWSDIMQNNKKLALIVGAAIILALILTPLFKGMYKRHMAYSAFEETDKALGKIQEDLPRLKGIMKRDMGILTVKDSSSLEQEISKVEDRLLLMVSAVEEGRSLIKAKRYGDVRKKFHPSFGLKKGESRKTPLMVLCELQKKVDDSIAFCTERREVRDKVWLNERYFIARLYIPISAVESDDEKLSLLPKEMLKLIPMKNEKVEAEIKQLASDTDPVEFFRRMNNSFGYNLVKNKPVWKHIYDFARNDEVRQRGNDFFDSARRSYFEVMPRNDSLLWYRPEKHDGNMSDEESKKLLSKQESVLSFVSNADGSLVEMNSYYDELHEQWYIYVSSQRKEYKTIRHVRYTRERVGTDENGDSKYEDVAHPYYTQGNDFYYTLTTVTPSGRTEKEKYVGDTDSEYSWDWDSWDYKADEEVGFIREWKRLHFDKSQIIRGANTRQMTPYIQELHPRCKERR